jgi:hypothetical protein
MIYIGNFHSFPGGPLAIFDHGHQLRRGKIEEARGPNAFAESFQTTGIFTFRKSFKEIYSKIISWKRLGGQKMASLGKV